MYRFLALHRATVSSLSMNLEYQHPISLEFGLIEFHQNVGSVLGSVAIVVCRGGK